MYSGHHDVYNVLEITVKDAKFTLTDTYRFKKGKMVHSFEIIDMGIEANKLVSERQNIRARMLVIAIYNGSKIKEFTFGVNRAVENRLERKLIHSINFRTKITQVYPILD